MSWVEASGAYFLQLERIQIQTSIPRLVSFAIGVLQSFLQPSLLAVTTSFVSPQVRYLPGLLPRAVLHACVYE